MAGFTAKFSLIDDMSNRLANIAERGQDIVSQWEQMGDTANTTFDGISNVVSSATTSVDGVAVSIADLRSQMDEWGDDWEKELDAANRAKAGIDEVSTSADTLSDTINNYSRAAGEAASQTDFWTDAVGNYDKSALEAIYSTEELVEMGFKSAEALEASAAAAEEAASANDKVSDASEELSKATQKATEEAENGGKKGVEAVEGIASALAAAGITAMVKEAAGAVYDLATAFSEAESTVVLATGATGEALNGLTASMMDAYAASKTGTLDETAAAVGEINTRLGYTDTQLEETTGLFLDFAAVTGGNAASSVRSVTQLMSQWNIPASEMEKVLSKLTYAGQASGISVDNLTQQLTQNKPILDQLGFSLDEATAMFMKFELAGTNTTAVMTGFRSALSSGAISSLEELYDVFDQISSGAMTAAEASELFGTRAGPAIVNAVNSGVLSLDDMVGSLEAADGTLKTTAEAAQTLDQKWTQASNNMSAAFQKAVEPTVSKISSGFADLVNGIGKFLNDHPAVTKAITAIGIGLGVVVAGIAGVTFVTTVAIPAVTAFGVALNTALGPIGWVALAIAGIVAAGTALVAMMSDAEDETANMTQTTRAQYYELQDLNAEYDEACEKYGENSEEALRLKYQVDDLSEAFEANRQTLEEFEAEVDELCESVSQLSEDFNTAITDINANETGTLALIQKYEDLATQTNLTGAQQRELKAITKELNDTYPELAQKIGTATASTEDYVEAMRKACEQEAEQLRQQEAQEAYTEALKKKAELADELAKAEENLRLSEESDANAAFLSDAWFYNNTGWLGTWATQTDEYKESLEELNAANAENEALIAEIEQEWENLAAAEEEAANQSVSYEDAVTTALDSVQTDMDELCEAYDAAYEAARSSIDSTIGLFDTMKVECETSVEDMMSALESQTEYLNTYAENLKLAAQYGLDEGLIQSLSDGSTESAAYLQEIISNIEELGGTTEGLSAEAQAFVDNFNGAFTEVETAKDQFATTVADMETDFSTKVDEIGAKMQEMVVGMNMSDEAEAQAKATLDSYISSIKAKQAEAVSAAEAVAAATAAALSSTASSSAKVSVPGHAKGTTNAENAFVAGENGPELVVRRIDAYANGTTDSAAAFIAGDNGPELIVGQQGSTVFPTEETDRLIDALSGRQEQPLQVYAGDGSSGKEKPSEQVKRILLEIAGSGAIEVGGGGGVDKETVLEILYDHLKPVLMNIIQGEIYEEGELSYEY